MPRLHKHTVDRFLARPDGELDLHGLTKKEAGTEFIDFMTEAENLGWKTVRIIVGKGWNSPDGKSVLGDYIRQLAEDWGYRYRNAKLNEGGDGVLIVNLY